MAFLVKALFRWNECSKNTDISVLSNFLAIVFEFFSLYREILPSTIYMPNVRSIGLFKQILQPYQSAKSPACLGLNLGVLKKLFAGFGRAIALLPPPPPPPPLATALRKQLAQFVKQLRPR